MNQLELLWDYQQTDIQAEAVAKEIKRSPARQKLVKYRDYLLEQQNTIKRIEDEVLTMQDRLAVLEDAVQLVEDQLNNLQKKMDAALLDLGRRYGLDFAGNLDKIFHGETLYRTIEYMRKHRR